VKTALQTFIFRIREKNMTQHQNCHIEPVVKPVDQAALDRANVVYLAIQGMGCPHCATRVQNGLLQVDGVLLAEVVLEHSLAVVTFDSERVMPAGLVQAVADARNDGRHHYSAHVLMPQTALDMLRPQ
jgi:copper chaperone CopZ